MSQKGLHLYLISQALLLGLIEAGKCIGCNGRTLQVLMYTAIVINTIMAAHRFCQSGSPGC